MRVLNIKENKDGSANIDIAIPDTERELIRKAYKLKKLTNKKLKTILEKVIEKYAKKEGAKYGIKTT